ncbi:MULTISPECIES: hypothetical protein [Methylosinus]|uniref:Uncharacterized protein n=1 Tax=Methylosinus trichosporium (strain ATCC 35070 / NCIMB 11131 / UNIQEM 75 / OB3b) TaxID=595536 RepID=A0A2D2CW08_METT3|nr:MULTISPECIES: hypothetical protein [Methylosinus]ATQ66895.1 hypothetical protein CQW49_02525 [Methylosinus trichosporium OB3b]OBS54141.1 hypothetical protein A8B73_02615 [Methylosinus sp. 3S-1]
MTLSELITARAEAGAAYVAAVAELRSTIIELAALDATLANLNVSTSPNPPATFFQLASDHWQHLLRHPDFVAGFAPLLPEVNDRRDLLIACYPSPEG